MVRAGLSSGVIVTAALDLIDQAGPAGLTLAAVAERLGVATPSLYKHVANLAELRRLVAVRILADLTTQLTTAVMGRSGDEAVTQLMHTYRTYVQQHPGRYAAVPPDPLHGDPDVAAAGTQLLEVFLAVLRAYHLPESATIHAIRRLRSIAHGFTSIEASGGFGLPEDVDETYQQLIAMFLTSLPGATTARPVSTPTRTGEEQS